MTPFNGLSAFPITPADATGQVLTDDLAALVERLVTAEVSSIGLLGSTGTYAYLTRAERARAVSAAVEAVAGRVPLIVGAGALRTDAAVALAEDAAAAGADALLLAPVSYTPLTQDEVFAHFTAVHDATDLPLCIYNNPGTTHFNFSEELIQRLAALPRVKAVKMPLPADGNESAEIARLRKRVPASFRLGYSGDWGMASTLLAGADAFYSVAGGLWPDQTMALARAALSGDREATSEHDARFRPMWDLFRQVGSLRVVYAAAQLIGLTTAEPPRPILPLDGATRTRVRDAMEALEG